MTRNLITIIIYNFRYIHSTCLSNVIVVDGMMGPKKKSHLNLNEYGKQRIKLINIIQTNHAFKHQNLLFYAFLLLNCQLLLYSFVIVVGPDPWGRIYTILISFSVFPVRKSVKQIKTNIFAPSTRMKPNAFGIEIGKQWTYPMVKWIKNMRKKI